MVESCFRLCNCCVGRFRCARWRLPELRLSVSLWARSSHPPLGPGVATSPRRSKAKVRDGRSALKTSQKQLSLLMLPMLVEVKKTSVAPSVCLIQKKGLRACNKELEHGKQTVPNRVS